MDGIAFQAVAPLEHKQIQVYIVLFHNVQLIVLVLIAVVILVGFVLEVFVFLEQQIIQDHIQLKLNV